MRGGAEPDRRAAASGLPPASREEVNRNVADRDAPTSTATHGARIPSPASARAAAARNAGHLRWPRDTTTAPAASRSSSEHRRRPPLLQQRRLTPPAGRPRSPASPPRWSRSHPRAPESPQTVGTGLLSARRQMRGEGGRGDSAAEGASSARPLALGGRSCILSVYAATPPGRTEAMNRRMSPTCVVVPPGHTQGMSVSQRPPETWQVCFLPCWVPGGCWFGYRVVEVEDPDHPLPVREADLDLRLRLALVHGPADSGHGLGRGGEVVAATARAAERGKEGARNAPLPGGRGGGGGGRRRSRRRRRGAPTCESTTARARSARKATRSAKLRRRRAETLRRHAAHPRAWSRRR